MTNNNDSALVNPNNRDQDPIEAEIIRDTGPNTSKAHCDTHSENDHNQVVDLVHQSIPTQTNDELVLGPFDLQDNSPEVIFNTNKSWLEYLSTPWGLGSFALLLLANIIVSWVQLSTSSNVTTAQKPLDATSPEKSPLVKELNLTESPQESFSLESLTTLPPQPKSTAETVIPNQMALKAKTINPSLPPSNLTDALLPPSLQPRPIAPSYPMPSQVSQTVSADTKANTQQPVATIPSPPPLKVPSAVVPVNLEPPLPPTNQIISQEQSPKPSFNTQTPTIEISAPASRNSGDSAPMIEISSPSENGQAPRIEISPLVSSNSEVSQDEKVRQTILQQLTKEQTEASPMPLGFSNKRRLEMQNSENQISPRQLPRQMKQLEHLQQRRLLDSGN